MQRKLKIVIITPYYVPHPGGVEVHTKFLVDHLKNYNVAITIVSSNIPVTKSLEEDSIIKIIRLKPILEIFFNPICLDLFKILLKIDADIFHIQGYWHFFADIATIVARIRKIPVIFSSHGFQQNVYKQGIVGRFIVQFYLKTIGKFMFKNLRAFTCNHIEDKEILEKIGVPSEKIYIIPSGICVADYLQVSDSITKEDVAKLGQKLNLSWPNILYVGSLIARKGLHFLIKAMPYILTEFPDAKLIVVGKGREQQNFTQEVAQLGIQQSVLFISYVKPISKDLILYYKLADLQVLPSFSESMPVVIMEGLLFGVPQMVTDRHFAKWIQYKGQPLYMPINPLKIKEFAERITQVLKNTSYKEYIQKLGPVFVEEELDWGKKIKQIYNLYLNLLPQAQLQGLIVGEKG